MLNNLEKIKIYLDSQAGLIVSQTDETEKNVVDNRIKLIEKEISLIENKDYEFYSELIKLISVYIDKLYETEINDFPNVVFATNGKLIPQNYDILKRSDIFNLRRANRDFCESLFNFVCNILENNKDVKLDIETLTKLLNRNPKPFEFTLEESYLYRCFDFKKLVKILKNNETLSKSNISIDNIYQMLIDAYQIDNEDVFGHLIKPEEFKENNAKIIELLNKCNAQTFVKITDIIIRYFDKDFDRLTIAKKRTTKNFFERLIICILKSRITENDSILIHKLLNDKEISINYNYYYADYFGQSSLKELLAFSNDRNIIKDLLSKPENIQNCYFNGDYGIQLYRLYAILGDYEKAVELFEKNYNYAHDFTEDYTSGFKDGYATGDFTYSDSLVEFVRNICNSFEKDAIDYDYKKDIIDRILNSQNVIYINIDEVLPMIKNTLSSDDFAGILSILEEKHKSGKLGFIAVDEKDSFYDKYTIRLATEEEIFNSLARLKNKNHRLVKKIKNR